MPETLPIRPADLLIDEENPRISQPNAGQNKAHQSLAQHQQRKLQMLARDIVQNGLNPSELPIVMAFKDDLNRFQGSDSATRPMPPHNHHSRCVELAVLQQETTPLLF